MFTSHEGGILEAEFFASIDSPLHNLVIIINNWEGGNAELQINGENISSGKEFRQGIEYDVEGNQKLIVYIKINAEDDTELELIPAQLSME